jgi:hypothetical protein
MTNQWTVPIITLLLCVPVAAQPERSLDCDKGGRNGQERFCEVREFPQPGVPRLVVDGRTNGGVSIKGWTRNEMLVRAKVETWAPTEAEARSLSRQITLQTAGGTVRADAPDFGSERGWAVSYEIFVPQATDLSLKAHNGGISIADVRGTAEFDAVNGGVTLKRLGGTVHGRTKNGGLSVELAGNTWEGRELDVSTTNGGVSMRVPANYSARLETRTVNGGVSSDFPVTAQGRSNRELSVTLGSGGPLIRAVTTNGGISVKRIS